MYASYLITMLASFLGLRLRGDRWSLLMDVDLLLGTEQAAVSINS